MGSSHSTPAPIRKGIEAALDHDDELYAFPGDALYEVYDVKPYNLDRIVRPVAVTYPKTAAQVAAIIKVAVENKLKVQARGGGHSYANYCIGGIDGAVVVDVKHFQQFHMNTETWKATIGAGTLLDDVTKRLHENGNRAMAHGTCPQVGISGHATIGGLGPTSRMWGTSLDHIEEVEIVLADSSIIRASSTQHEDVFWAIRGAGASFGIITEFVMRTELEPGQCVQFSFSFTLGKYKMMANTFKSWQKFVSNPKLTRKFTTEVIITQLGLVISGTYFGSKAEYDAFELDTKFPGAHDKKTLILKDWLGIVGNWASEAAIQLGGGIAAPLYTKSLTFNGCHLIPDRVIDSLFSYLDRVDKGTLTWFIIFDLEGGRTNDIPQDATAYAHRDALFYMQSYAVGIPRLRDKTRYFLTGVNETVRIGMPGGDNLGAYAGYVDPELRNGQEQYWRTNLPRLERIKLSLDATQVFWNPQSIRPAGSPPDPSYKKTKHRSVFRSFFCQG